MSDLLAGQGYQIIERVGDGGYGTVLKATDGAGEVVAVKVIRRDLAAVPALVSGFVKEGALMRKLSAGPATNLVRCRRVLTDNDDVAFVMDFVPAGNLRQYLIASGGTISPAQAFEISARICDGLALLHHHGVAHRDIKPSNIMMGPARPGETTPEPLITDLGIASTVGSDTSSFDAPTGDPTGASAFGTVDYLAPELLGSIVKGDQRPDPRRGDLYSVGCVLYQMLTGSVPFPMVGREVIIDAHRRLRPAPIPELPARAWAVVADLLHKRPMAPRPENAADAAAALRAAIPLLDGMGPLPAWKPDPAEPDRGITRQRGRVRPRAAVFALLGAAVLLLLGAAIVLPRVHGRDPALGDLASSGQAGAVEPADNGRGTKDGSDAASATTTTVAGQSTVSGNDASGDKGGPSRPDGASVITTTNDAGTLPTATSQPVGPGGNVPGTASGASKPADSSLGAAAVGTTAPSAALAPVPAQLSAPSATAGDRAATLSFAQAAGATGYDVLGSDGVIRSVAGPGGAIGGLLNGVTYSFQVRACNGAGCGAWSSPSSLVVPAGVPAVPTGLTQSDASLSAIRVSWNGADGNGRAVTSYELLVDGAPIDVGNVTTWVHGGLGAGQAHTYAIRSVSPIGRSDWSVSVTGTSTAAPAAATFSETVGGNAHTWTNYANGGGTEGQLIPAFSTVQVSCRLEGLRVQDGNTWWYRIASSPWNNAYYVSADAFYNNGATSGSLVGTPFVDTRVPPC